MESLEKRVQTLNDLAKEVRFHILSMIHTAGSGHPGGSLSSADIMTALYFDVLSIDPKNPLNPERDRFILSKGHACPAWYTCLAMRGFFPIEELLTLRRANSRIQGHPVAGKCPGIDATTGSLGVGFGQAVGMALEAKMTGKKYRVYTILGDGELNEGIIWESCNTAAKFKLHNLTAIVDNNKLQNDGFGRDIMPMGPLAPRFEAMGWKTLEINGHKMEEILKALDEAKNYTAGPLVIIADTIKVRGVSFMENSPDWHGKATTDEELARAMAEIKGARP